MGFEVPLMLLGLSAAFIPIVVHLLNRSKAPTRPFAAIEFLLLQDDDVLRRLKLRHFMVLLVRIALMLAVALALSKPYMRMSEGVAVDRGAPGSTVLIIDDSASMQTRPSDERQSYLERALAKARTEIEAGGLHTEFAIIAAGKPARVLTAGMTHDRALLKELIGAITPTYKASDLAGALKAAGQILAESSHKERRVVIIGDHARHAWDGIEVPWHHTFRSELLLVDVSEQPLSPNVGIRHVQIHPVMEAGSKRVRIEARVDNHAAVAQKGRLIVEVAGKTSATTYDIAPHRSETLWVTETIEASEVEVTGAARIAADTLAVDNVYYFHGAVGRTVNLAVFNGSPHNVPRRDEVFFLKAALSSDGGDKHQIRSVYLALSALEPTVLRGIDVVLLANVASLSPQQRTSLEKWVDSGGGLFITGGDQLTPESNAGYGHLLPYALRTTKVVVDSEAPVVALKALRLRDVDLTHPIFQPFAELEEASLFNTRVGTYLLLEGSRKSDVRTLARLTGGAPALVEATMGQGKTLLWVSSIDKDWSDLAIKTCFVPFIRQTVAYLGGVSEHRPERTFVAGQNVRIEAPRGQGALVLTGPNASKDLSADDSEGDEQPSMIPLGVLDTPGHYALRRKTDPTKQVKFSINPNSEESDLKGADHEKIYADWNAHQEESEEGSAAAMAGLTSDGVQHRTPLWPYVLVGLFFLLMSEAFLVIRT